LTCDGIELGGERVCREIEEEIEKLAEAGKEIKRFSIVGYSLGGLVARYVIGLLYSKGFFDRIEPVVRSSSELVERMPLISTVEPLYKNTLHKNTLTKTSIFLCNSRLPKNLLLVNLPEYKNTLTKTSYILMKFGVPSIFL
jgi:hypothetical protein